MRALLTTESEYYSAFLAPRQRTRLTESFRLLAPSAPVTERILPENQAEADRLRALPPRQLIVTARSEQGVAGFISELPTVF